MDRSDDGWLIMSEASDPIAPPSTITRMTANGWALCFVGPCRLKSMAINKLGSGGNTVTLYNDGSECTALRTKNDTNPNHTGPIAAIIDTTAFHNCPRDVVFSQGLTTLMGGGSPADVTFEVEGLNDLILPPSPSVQPLGTAAWYEADTLPYPEAALVPTWPDASGHVGIDLAQTDPALQFLYRANAFNGRACVQSGVYAQKSYMRSALALPQPMTIFTVESSFSNTGCLFDDTNRGNGNYGVTLNPNGLGGYQATGVNFTCGQGINSIVGGTLIVLVYDGVNSEVRVNGQLVVAGDLQSMGLSAFTLGTRWDADGDSFQGLIALAGFVGRHMTRAEIINYSATLMAKYRIPAFAARTGG